MHVLDAFAELELGRENEYGKVELKTDAAFDAKIGWRQLHQVLRLSGGRVGGEIVLIVESPEHIDAEIVDPVGKEFHVGRKTQQKRLDLFGGDISLACRWIVHMIGESVVGKDEFRKGNAELQVIGDAEGKHARNAEPAGVARRHGKNTIALQELRMRCHLKMALLIHKADPQIISF